MAAASAFTGTGGATMSGSVVVLVARPRSTRLMCSSSSLPPPARCAVVGTATPATETAPGGGARRSGQLAVPPGLVDDLVEEALVWCSQHGLVVGDKNHPVSDVPCYLAIPTYFTSHVHASRSS